MADLIESLSGITAPVTKLIEVVSDGIGALYAPRRIRKEADARAYEIGTIEKAKTAAEINRKSKNSKHQLDMPVYTLTEVGRELFKLTKPKFHPEYFDKLIAQLKGMDNVSVYQTKDFSKTSDGQYNYNEESLEKC